jgi:hypothetical protein
VISCQRAAGVIRQTFPPPVTTGVAKHMSGRLRLRSEVPIILFSLSLLAKAVAFHVAHLARFKTGAEIRTREPQGGRG